MHRVMVLFEIKMAGTGKKKKRYEFKMLKVNTDLETKGAVDKLNDQLEENRTNYLSTSPSKNMTVNVVNFVIF